MAFLAGDGRHEHRASLPPLGHRREQTAACEVGAGEVDVDDLPPLGEGADEQAGCLVPQRLRSSWHMVRGRSRRVLPGLISQLPHIDIFLHDSLHTYRNMLWEFQTAWSKLTPGVVLMSDDVAMNRAFEDFARREQVAFAAVTGESGRYRNFGVMVKARSLFAKE